MPDDLIIHFKLPDQGEIQLSQIKSEFNKGNNLTAYYGVTGGIPSSGRIKLTDFYGKPDGPTPTPPSGYYYRSLTVWRNQKGKDENGLGYFWVVSFSGQVEGYPSQFPVRAGYLQSTTTPDYPPQGGSSLFMFQSVQDSAFYNSYEKAYIQPDSWSSESEYYTSWADGSAEEMSNNYTDPLSPTQTILYSRASNTQLGVAARTAIDRGEGFSIRLSN